MEDWYNDRRLLERGQDSSSRRFVTRKNKENPISSYLTFIMRSAFWFVAVSCLTRVLGFVLCSRSSRLHRSELQSAVSEQVDRLLHLVEKPLQSDTIAQIRQILPKLTEEPSAYNDSNAFEELLGNYNVSSTLPTKDGESPVGGKWNSFAKIEHSWQHILPARQKGSVAQVINMIVLRVFSTFTINVILRGDAFSVAADNRKEIAEQRQTPGGLSAQTVQADFDPPRIIVCRKKPWLSLSLGPKSSVVLDTPFCDSRVRIGKGSRGSQFVFVRTDDPRADTWITLLGAKTLGKRSLLAMLGSLSGLLWWSQARLLSGIARWLIILPSAITTTLLTALIAFSTGGIEGERGNSTMV